ncbi:MAG: hypothetical protein HYY35_02225 [Deltaproteobacteria bacterium]|nr:hypothetical protein [Deltaproteobacteria bacterium]
MLTVNANQIELMQKIARKIDRRLMFQLHHLADGSIEVKLSHGNRKTETRVSSAALEAARDDVAQFEALRLQVKRVYDRMWAPAPPPKTPRVEIQRDIAFGFRPGGQRGRPGGPR